MSVLCKWRQHSLNFAHTLLHLNGHALLFVWSPIISHIQGRYSGQIILQIELMLCRKNGEMGIIPPDVFEITFFSTDLIIKDSRGNLQIMRN